MHGDSGREAAASETKCVGNTGAGCQVHCPDKVVFLSASTKSNSAQPATQPDLAHLHRHHVDAWLRLRQDGAALQRLQEGAQLAARHEELCHLDPGGRVGIDKLVGEAAHEGGQGGHEGGVVKDGLVQPVR